MACGGRNCRGGWRCGGGGLGSRSARGGLFRLDLWLACGNQGNAMANHQRRATGQERKAKEGGLQKRVELRNRFHDMLPR